MTTSPGSLIELAESDPQGCVEKCDRILAGSPLGVESADALRARGIARRGLGEIRDSIADLEAARDRYRELGIEEEADESAISLAASVAMSGDLDEAIRSLELLLASGKVSTRAHAEVQLAGIVAISGDFERALSLYSIAQPKLETLGDTRWLALLHSTRGLVHTYRRAFNDAEQDLSEARGLFADLGRRSSVAEMDHNLGFVAVQRGDVARGIGLLVEAEASYEAAGLPVDDIGSDKANAYMLAGMPGPAFETASATARRLAETSRETERTEALYFAARAALADGRLDSARDYADRAWQLADRLGRVSWMLQARVIAEEARYRAGMSGSSVDVMELARTFETRGDISNQIHALALAALRDIAAGEFEEAQTTLDLANGLVDETTQLEVRLLLAVATARLSIDEGSLEDAFLTLGRAADVVDEYRVMLSATEARAGITRLADEIADLGVVAGRERDSLMDWVDRFRGASLRIAPVVRDENPEIARALSELRAAVRDFEELAKEGEDTGDAAVEVRQLETRVRDLAMAARAPSRASSGRSGRDEISAQLGDRAMLYIYDMGEETFAELLTGESDSERISLGSAPRLRSLSRHMAAAFRREFMVGDRHRSDPSRVHRTIAELAEIVFDNSHVPEYMNLVVVPPPDLMSLPWNAMATISDPNARLTVAPSARSWLTANSPRNGRDSVGIIAGPELGWSVAEAEQVAAVYGANSTMLAGEASTVEAASAIMGECGVVHVVAHTRLREDNPMFSALQLADGYMNLHDLEGLTQVPDVVVLSACDSSHGSVVGGHEMYGLTSVFLGRGSRTILATVAPIPDSNESIEANRQIHSELLAGRSSADALAAAQANGDLDTVDPAVAFVAYGI